MLRDYLGGWADLITGPQVGENLVLKLFFLFSAQALMQRPAAPLLLLVPAPELLIGPKPSVLQLMAPMKSPGMQSTTLL